MMTKKWLFCVALTCCIFFASCTGTPGTPAATDPADTDTKVTYETPTDDSAGTAGNQPADTAGGNTPSDDTNDDPPPSGWDYPFTAADPDVANGGDWTPFY